MLPPRPWWGLALLRVLLTGPSLPAFLRTGTGSLGGKGHPDGWSATSLNTQTHCGELDSQDGSRKGAGGDTPPDQQGGDSLGVGWGLPPVSWAGACTSRTRTGMGFCHLPLPARGAKTALVDGERRAEGEARSSSSREGDSGRLPSGPARQCSQVRVPKRCTLGDRGLASGPTARPGAHRGPGHPQNPEEKEAFGQKQTRDVHLGPESPQVPREEERADPMTDRAWSSARALPTEALSAEGWADPL